MNFMVDSFNKYLGFILSRECLHNKLKKQMECFDVSVRVILCESANLSEIVCEIKTLHVAVLVLSLPVFFSKNAC